MNGLMFANLRRTPDRESALKHYRELASNYDASCWAVGGMRRRALALLTLKEGETVFDVACGTGVMLAELARRVGPRGRVIGIEQSPEMAGIARARLRREAVDPVVTVIEAAVEEAVLECEADALLFFYTHDVLQSPRALTPWLGCWANCKPWTAVPSLVT